MAEVLEGGRIRASMPGVSQKIGGSIKEKAEDKGDENLAAWLCGINDIRILPFSLPTKLGPFDVRLKMRAVGICGSDVHYLKHMKCADFVVKQPMVIGHESAGEVIEVGSLVTRCKVGDRVALEPGQSCSKCPSCKSGRYNLCPEMKFFATPPINGSLAHEIVHPEDLCFPLPEEVTTEEGAMCEPLSVGVHACRRAGCLAGANAVIIGAGPIGIITMMVAKAFGATRVVVADVDDQRLQFASRMGADAIVGLSAVKREKSCAEEEIDSALIQAATSGSQGKVNDKQEQPSARGKGASVTFDCAGFESSMRIALAVTEAGGKVILVGMGANEMKLPLTAAAAQEVDILGVFRYCNTYPTCIDLIQRKKVNLKPLITHRYGFSEAEVHEAFSKSASGGSVMKVMFNL